MKVMVVGAGSIGFLLAAKLAEAGAEVTLMCRTAEQAAKIGEEGITFYTENVAPTQTRLPAALHWGSTATDVPDWTLVAVKQTHWDNGLLAQLARLAASGSKLIALQNGIGHAERLLAAGIPADSLCLGVTTEAARREGESTVAHTGHGMTWIGQLAQAAAASQASLSPLLERLAAAGFDACAVPDIERHLWRKLLINAAMNPIAALFNVRNGELAERPELRRMMHTVLAEGLAVAKAAGILLDEGMWETVLEVCAKTARNDASMLQDMRAGRRTEIEAITGSLVREAAQRDVSVPLNEALYRLVLAIS